MARINHKALESTYQSSQGTLDTRLSKGGLKVTTRQIAKVLASHLPYTEVVRSESKAKFSIACDFQEVTRIDAGKAMGLLNQSTLDKPVRKVVKQSQTQVTIPTNIKVTMLESKLPKRKRAKLSPFRVNVDWITTELDSLPQEVKTSLACAYVFSSRVPRQEREDMLQGLVANLLQFIKDKSWTVGLDGSGIVSTLWTGYTLSESLAYRIAKCDTLDYWRRIKGHSQECESVEAIAESPDILDYSQEEFRKAIENMEFDNHTTEVLKVEKILHESIKETKVQYTSEANRRKELKDVYYNLQDSIEYENQVIGKLDFKATMSQLPKAIKKIVTRLTDKLDESGNTIVKRTSLLSSAEYKALQRYANSSKGKQLKETLLASLRS
jgi:hypothetical protein